MGIYLEKTKRYFINKIPIAPKTTTLEDQPPFFIIGSGRNGSTLLSAILNNHPAIFIPPEQYALPYLALKWNYKTYFTWESKLRSSIDVFLKRSYNWKIDREEAFNHIYEKLTRKDSFTHFFRELNYLESKENDMLFSVFGDKTPYNTFYVPLLTKLYPKAKFIFLSRNPLDVVASLKRMNPKETMDQIIYRWSNSQEMYTYLLRNKISVEYYEYEYLVEHPTVCLEKIISFLELEEYADLFQNYNKHISTLGILDSKNHQNLYNSISVQQIGKYKEILSEKEIIYIRKKLKPYID